MFSLKSNPVFQFLNSPEMVRKFQRLNGIREGKDGKLLVNPFIDTWWRLWTLLLDEIGYFIFLPWLYFNIDSSVFRQATLAWAAAMYTGQALKEVFDIPRPASPPAYRLCRKYESEGGMPSTHAAVAVAIPFTVAMSCSERYDLSLFAALAMATVVAVNTSLSRIYLGVHSFSDILGGAMLSVLLLYYGYPRSRDLDQFLFTNTLAPVFCASSIAILCYLYPRPEKWSTARADTNRILSVTLGGILSTVLLHRLGFYTPAYISGAAVSLPAIDLLVVLRCCARYLIAGLLTGLSKPLIKPVTHRVVSLVAGIDCSADAAKHPSVEIPVVLVTYTLVSMTCTFVSVLLFTKIGLHTDEYNAW